jgi:hypothetical protein
MRKAESTPSSDQSVMVHRLPKARLRHTMLSVTKNLRTTNWSR